MNEKKDLSSTRNGENRFDIPNIGIGMLGYAFMGKAHSNGYIRMPYIFWPPPARPKLIKICGRNKEKVSEAAIRYGYSEYCTDWNDLINDDRIEIFVNVAPDSVHVKPCIEAAKAGKNLVCEKPLAPAALDAKLMLEAAEEANVKHLCNYNYRMVPAIILAKNLITSGKLGKIYHFRAKYLQDWLADPDIPLVWRRDKKFTNSGAIGDFSHIIDLSRWLCGEIKSVMSVAKIFVDKRPLINNPSKKVKVEVYDAFATTAEFKNGAIGTLEGSPYCLGRKNYETFEINAENGSIFWDLENMNYLHVYLKDENIRETLGFHKISVTEPNHPYFSKWWPSGHIIGWEHTFVHTAYNIVDAVINNKKLEPMAATFVDGYKAAVICDAILKSVKSGRKEEIIF